MEKREVKERINRLKTAINKHRRLYHVEDRQEISDEALDSLKKELFDLEAEFPDLITPDSPTQRVGGEPQKQFKKVLHERRMLSFNDAFSREDMEAWVSRLSNYLEHETRDEKYYVELKIDGLAIELAYENGIFTEGSTRGDGQVGEDVTSNLKTVEAIPLRLNDSESAKREASALGLDPKRFDFSPKRLVVRGEVFIGKKQFEKINREQESKDMKLYANPRNIAAGSIRQLDPRITAARKLDSFEYSIVTDIGQRFHEEEHLLLRAMGFKTNPNNKLASGLDEIFSIRDYWEEHRDKLPYEIDGIVVLANNNSLFEEAGVIGKAPRAGIAYKFSPREATTMVTDIVVQVGRTGTLTPVAVMKPVSVGGTMVARATLHNADEIERLGLKIGDTVIVSRAGDVIPRVIKVLSEMRTGKEKKFNMPKYCPVDGSKVIREGVISRCSGKDCGARHREQLYHFVSRPAFDIRGLGPQIIDRFLDEGLISDAADIFSLEEKNIETLDRFGKKSAENLVKEIGEKKTILLERFIYALGILHVGEETARLLAKSIARPGDKTDTPCGVKEIMNGYSIDNLLGLPDIGPVVARSIYNWFREHRNTVLLDKLSRAGIKIQKNDVSAPRGKFAGKIFALTGSLNAMARDEAKGKIRALGGEVSETVSAKTSYVIAGSEPGSKYDKALKMGIPVLTEQEFIRFVE